VVAIAAHDLTALSSGVTSFVGRELVRVSLSMRRLAAPAGDLALPGLVHGGESSIVLDSAGAGGGCHV
jgi:hypothetical protein